MMFEYVDQPGQLRDAVARCMTAPAIAIDTEFARFNTYYPMVGLIQLYDGEKCFLIDPLELPDLEPLKALISSPDILKVFHSCSEDLEVFQHSMGLIPSPIFDTQISAALMGVGFSMSYQRLVEHYLNIILSKGETRSDWLQRPLTAKQLDYAALDVVHLYEVYQMQAEELASADRLHWVMEECARLGLDIPTMVGPDEWYKKIKGTARLSRQQLNVVKVLCAWREITAREENTPRNRIVDQKSLLSIAKLELSSKKDFQTKGSMTPRGVRKYGDIILSLTLAARNQSEDECPIQILKDNSPVNSQQLKRLRQVADEQAALLGVSPELLAKRRDIEEMIRLDGLPEGLLGWREEAIGKLLLREMDSF